MQAQLVCLLLLLCSSCVLSSDASQDLPSRLLAAQMKRGQTAPYWSNPLVNLCRILSNLRQDAWSNEEVEEEVRLMEESLQLQQEVHNTQKLQHLCGVLQGRGERQILQESLEYLEETAGSPLKRKSPYILKRQTGRTSKSRRPYILKRSAIY